MDTRFQEHSPFWVHDKTGKVYEVVSLGIDKTDGSSTEGEIVVIYKREDKESKQDHYYVRTIVNFTKKFTHESNVQV